MFLLLVRHNKNKNKIFTICGGNASSIRKNVISELEHWLGRSIKLGRYNEFELYGNTVYCIGIGDIGALKTIRGFTCQGTLINEVTTLNEDCVKEAQDRCSEKGSMILMDTNPTSPYSYAYTEIISKGNVRSKKGNLIQLVANFTLFDNTKLPDYENYLEQQLMRYPKGTTDYLRYILGQYASAEGVIYYMFKKDKHVIDSMPKGVGIAKYVIGQDFGFEHWGSILVIAKLTDGRMIVVDGVIEQHKDTDYWIERLKEYNSKYRISTVYADSARPDLISDERVKTRMDIQMANKSVLLGINYVKQLLNEGKLLFLEGGMPERLYKEFDGYAWDSKKEDTPIKVLDDGLDGLRYGLFSEFKKVEEPKSMFSTYKGARQGFKFKKR